jgi:hypothetical protein
MLQLSLRDEFLGTHMPQTAIRLVTSEKTGAAQQDPRAILEITYPTTDIQNALRALASKRQGRPIVLLGERGRGKSHIMAVMHHAIAAGDVVEGWAHSWGKKTGNMNLNDLSLQKGFFPISEAVQHNQYMLLWDLLFDRHPEGKRFQGRFEALKQPLPPRTLLEEMFKAQPTALILDEFQTWFDSLHDEPGDEGKKWRHCAFAFIQTLSEISKDRPDILILCISVLNNSTEAFRQVHRDAPVVIDFRGPGAKEDRQKLLLHRLFKNRDVISPAEIKKSVSVYGLERFKLRFQDSSGSERDAKIDEVAQYWPFSPELVDLLEDHILLSQVAQETRDLIRILAQVYRARGESVPIITPADFLVDDDGCGVQTLLDSIATMGTQEKLREVARRNLQSIRANNAETPHARELVSALWMRSMSPGRYNGGTRNELHLDITRMDPVDDNSFNAELKKVIDNSINIHGEESPDGKLHFDLAENPRSKIRSTARNNRLWVLTADSQQAGQLCYPGKDIEHIRKTIKDMFMPEIRQYSSKAVALGPNWRSDPWNEIEEESRPPRWTEPVLLVIPEIIAPDEVSSVLGPWLTKHIQKFRNTVRFLLIRPESSGLFTDELLLFNARCSYLASIAWKDDPQYRSLKSQFDKPLRDDLKSRFDRFAVLDIWNYSAPEQCQFHVEKIDKEGADIPPRVEEKILLDLFDTAEFEKFISMRARESYIMNDVLAELMDPASGVQALPYLGESQTVEKVFEIAAKGIIALNIEGNMVGRLPEHESEIDALRSIRRYFRTGPEMRKMQLFPPSVLAGPSVRGPQASVPPCVPTNGVPPQPPVQPVPPQGPDLGPAGEATREGQTRYYKTEEPAVAVNLTGSFEKWGISPETTLKSATIGFSDLSVNQVKQILMRIPSSIKANLEISFSEESKA